MNKLRILSTTLSYSALFLFLLSCNLPPLQLGGFFYHPETIIYNEDGSKSLSNVRIELPSSESFTKTIIFPEIKITKNHEISNNSISFFPIEYVHPSGFTFHINSASLRNEGIQCSGIFIHNYLPDDIELKGFVIKGDGGLILPDSITIPFGNFILKASMPRISESFLILPEIKLNLFTDNSGIAETIIAFKEARIDSKVKEFPYFVSKSNSNSIRGPLFSGSLHEISLTSYKKNSSILFSSAAEFSFNENFLFDSLTFSDLSMTDPNTFGRSEAINSFETEYWKMENIKLYGNGLYIKDLSFKNEMYFEGWPLYLSAQGLKMGFNGIVTVSRGESPHCYFWWGTFSAGMREVVFLKNAIQWQNGGQLYLGDAVPMEADYSELGEKSISRVFLHESTKITFHLDTHSISGISDALLSRLLEIQQEVVAFQAEQKRLDEEMQRELDSMYSSW